MRIHRVISDASGMVLRTGRPYFGKPIPKAWSVRDTVPPSHNSNSYFTRKIENNQVTIASMTYSLNLPVFDEDIAKYVSYKCDVYLANSSIFRIEMIFDGPEDIAMLWKLSL